MPMDFAETDGNLMMTDGFGPVRRWDGFTATALPAGLTAPTTALVIGGSGRGTILGEYQAYYRELDSDRRMSNLSPVSNTYDAQTAGGTITGATNASPIEITTNAAHGLANGDIIVIEDVLGNTDANGTWVVTVTGATTATLDDSSGNAAYTSGGTWYSGVDTIAYTSVDVPTDPKVTIRQILRSTANQATTFYVDVETEDMGATSFNSTRDDDELAAQTAQALLDENGDPLADIHLPPPQSKIAIVNHQDRLWYMGEEDYNAGSCKVTNTSVTVVGVGTDWVEALEGREFHCTDAAKVYIVSTVNEDAQTLTLTEAYESATNNFATYAIRSNSFDAKNVLFSEPGLPESLGAVVENEQTGVGFANSQPIRQNGDRITGGYASGPYLYVLEEKHVHRIMFGDDPLIDGGVFPASERGCVNKRCHAITDDRSFMLDEFGCHVFDPDGSKPISMQIQEIFRPQSRSQWRINWRARKHFHSVIHEQQDTVRWFVALSGCSRPKHALAYNYALERWWIEQYPRQITSSCVGRINGIPVVFVGSDARTVATLWQGTQDFVDSSKPGTKRGTVTSSTVTTITDSTAAFGADVVGAQLYIVDRTGRGQQRRIVARTATMLTVNYPWIIQPSATEPASVYQIGGVSWQWRSKRFALPESPTTRNTGFTLLFEPQTNPCGMDVQVFHDFSKAAIEWYNPMTSEQGDGVRTERGITQFTCDLTDERGYLGKSFPRKLAGGFSGPRYAAVNLSGTTNGEPVVIYELGLQGMA